MESINKQELVRRTALQAQIHEVGVGMALDALLDQIQFAMEKGGKVTLKNFGVFEGQHKDAREVRSPRNGEMIPVEAKIVPHFKFASSFKKRVAEGRALGAA